MPTNSVQRIAVPTLVIFTAVVFEVVGQICLKRGADSSSSDRAVSTGAFLIAVARSVWTYAAIGAYGIELLLWIAALHFAPLSQAFPLMSLTYCGVAIASRIFLNERISARNGIGIALITLGAVCLIGANA
jgi:multidrug transporter EmrE-like cation transporter